MYSVVIKERSFYLVLYFIYIVSDFTDHMMVALNDTNSFCVSNLCYRFLQSIRCNMYIGYFWSNNYVELHFYNYLYVCKNSFSLLLQIV